ncbi:DNA methyltransferase [Chitinispirillales bacterium ANBcel5]|uniref:DNA methyltransferase n=1 Tax=Cellulosispirillum alkaliphilum TaxID=3039283 RepID=UPI002A53832C|nr:DNA methyltransferase [Chitinispirillales bacterium ANBcel5]
MEKYRLFWPDYKLFEYEIEFAHREIQKITNNTDIKNNSLYVEVVGSRNKLRKLTYFSVIEDNKNRYETDQHILESYCSIQNGNSKQSTRYSVHGIHEYKGKFNPQIIRFLLNYLGISPKEKILDPFCGSGTTLAESIHNGPKSTGIDINPLAIYISNAKILALKSSPEQLSQELSSIKKKYTSEKNSKVSLPNTKRIIYLRKWFPEDTLYSIELLRNVVFTYSNEHNPIFLTILSNLLREYSLQEPLDLRIRRRKSPFPETNISYQFFKKCSNFLMQLERLQKVFPIPKSRLSNAINLDITNLDENSIDKFKLFDFDAAITSPPYATALPYIDTQRLSLVWLDLIEADNINKFETNLIGTRDFSGAQKNIWKAELETNIYNLPDEIFSFCLSLRECLNSNDGFRRQAVPVNLYRYFAQMQKMFKNVSRMLKSKAKYSLVVGHNHTTIGGNRFDINTPDLLRILAEANNWKLNEQIPLQTYKRYGLNQKNAVSKEDLIILENK